MVRSATTHGILALAALGWTAGPARAEPAGRLSYERGPGAEACPDEPALRRAVAARLGEDPFDPAHPRTFRLSITAGPRLSGTVELVADGVVEGRRELESAPEACGELVEAMALAVSLTINPNLVVAARPPLVAPAEAASASPPPAPAPSLAPPRSTPQPDDPPARARTQPGGEAPLALAAGAFAHGAVGTGPGPALGASVLLRAGKIPWSVGLEGRVDAFSRANAGLTGTVYSELVAGVLAPCVHGDRFLACPVLLLGSMFARSRGVTTRRSDQGFFAAAGARLGLSAPLTRDVRLETRLDVLHALTAVAIDLNGAPVWRAGASGALAVGLVRDFP